MQPARWEGLILRHNIDEIAQCYRVHDPAEYTAAVAFAVAAARRGLAKFTTPRDLDPRALRECAMAPMGVTLRLTAALQESRPGARKQVADVMVAKDILQDGALYVGPRSLPTSSSRWWKISSTATHSALTQRRWVREAMLGMGRWSLTCVTDLDPQFVAAGYDVTNGPLRPWRQRAIGAIKEFKRRWEGATLHLQFKRRWEGATLHLQSFQSSK